MRRVASLFLVALLAACSGKNAFSKLPPAAPKAAASTTTATTEANLSAVPLPRVDGATTTTVVIGPGPMTIVGRVEGPDGVIPDAIVQLERLAGDGVATARVPTAPDGTWNLANVLGGRYRIRAWRAPDLSSSAPQIVFIESGPEREVTVHVDPVGGVRVDAAIAPDPPVVGQPANLKVRVADRSVDGEGVIRDTPQAGESVTLVGAGDWSVGSPNPSTTGGDGTTIYRVTCGSAGNQSLFAQLSSGESYALTISACVRPGTTTTSTSSTSSTTTTTR